MNFVPLIGSLGIISLLLGCRPQTQSSPAMEQVAARQRPGPARNWAPITTWPKGNAAEVDRLEWNRRTLKGAYDTIGIRDGRWDNAARQGLDGFARLRAEQSNLDEVVRTNVAEAIRLGCTDPMIKYLELRFAAGSAESASRRADQYQQVSEKLGESGYSAIRKFYAYLRAAQAQKTAYGGDTNSGKPYLESRRQAFGELRAFCQEPDLPAVEVLDAAQELMEVLKDNATQKLEVFPVILECLHARWPSNALARRVCGRAHIGLGWSVRGSGYADSVAAADWEEFKRHMDAAEIDLEASWKLDPKDADTAIAMMEVELGQGRGKDRLDLWFQRAMTLNPANYDAVHAKAWYLQPKWHGSVEELLAFGRECVRSKDWKGNVPLILWESHRLLSIDLATGLKDKHWVQPGVWEDVELSFEGFFASNPQAMGWYHDYALYAFKCKKYGKFLDLLPRLGSVREAYFGGAASFGQMIEAAEKATGRKVERPPREVQRAETE